MNKGYIRSLDGLRGIAILLVMSFHAGLNQFGWMGVQLFFVLSGFLITRILWKEKMTGGSRLLQFRNFWIRRSLRIFPLYFAFLALLGLSYLVVAFPSYLPQYFAYLVTYTVNYTRTADWWIVTPLFTHLWSLSIEEQFYLFFPFIILLAPVRLIRILLVAVIILAPLVRLFLGNYYNSGAHSEYVVADAVYWNTLSHLDAFFMGAILTVFPLPQQGRLPSRLLVAGLLLVIVAGFVNYTYTKDGGNYLASLGYAHGFIAHGEHTWQYTMLNLFFAALIYSLTAASSFPRFRRLLEAGWLVEIGKVSYGMYLIHWAVLVYIFNRYLGMLDFRMALLLFIPYVAVVYGLAWLSFHFFESRFIKLKDALTPASKKP